MFFLGVLLSCLILSKNLLAQAYGSPILPYSTCDEDELAFTTSLVQKQLTLAKTSTAHSTSQIATSHDDQSTSMYKRKLNSSTCELMLPLWQVAAESLGQNGSSRCDFIEDFYEQSIEDGKPELTNDFNFPPYSLQQIVIRKCASSEMHANLRDAQAHLDMDTSFENVNFSKVRDPDEGQFLENVSFAMVRDPMLHFVSGFSQIQYWAEHCPDETVTFKGAADDSEAAMAFVHDVLNMNLDPTCWVNIHIYSMLGPLRKYNAEHGEIQFVGRLENFDEDWATVQVLVDHTFPPWQPDLASHRETDGASGFSPRTAMESTLTDAGKLDTLHPTVVLALGCSILLPDYVCLEYPNPVTDRDCVEAGFALSSQAWHDTVSRIKNNMCPQIKTYTGRT